MDTEHMTEPGTQASEQFVVISLHPDVDPQGMPDLRLQLHSVVMAGARDIVVDTSCIDELPSAVIGALLTAHRACRGRGGQVVIRYPSRRALDQLHRTGLWRVFHIESDGSYAPASRRAKR